MTNKLLYLCLFFYITVITSQKCGYIHLSISAKNKSIVMNWRYNCMDYPKRLVLHHNGKDVATIIIKSDAEKISHMGTNNSWNYDVFPGNLYPNNSNPLRSNKQCYQYQIVSYKDNKIDDNQCLMANVQWMSMFPSFSNLRLGDMYIPGTRYSGAIGRHQHYDLWGQLVFGMRYFDIPIKIIRNNNNKHIFRTLYSQDSLQKHLELFKRFMEMTKKEVVILDFRCFRNFKGDEDHIMLIDVLKNYMGKWFANKNITYHRYGPKLSELWKNKKRIIINYGYEPMVAKHDYLWNDIFIQNGEKTSPEDLRKHFKETLQNDSYKEMMRGYVFALHSSENTDKKELADEVNPEVSNWYNFDMNQRRVNIIIVDFFESSKIHIDAIWLNRNYH